MNGRKGNIRTVIRNQKPDKDSRVDVTYLGFCEVFHMVLHGIFIKSLRMIYKQVSKCACEQGVTILWASY